MIRLSQTASYKNKHIELFGDLTQNAEGLLEPVFLSGVETVTIDLKNLTAINSVGIRFFMIWIADFSKVALTFENCPPFFIDQVNMVSGFLPSHSKVKSFFVPYFAEETGFTKWVLYTEGQEYRRTGAHVLMKHFTTLMDDQGYPMHPDVLESKFFKFLDQYA